MGYKRVSIYALAVLGLCFAVVTGGLFLGGNFHRVYKDEVYRSAQLSPKQLAARIAEYRIRGIVNLRGSDPGKAWYEHERATAKAHGVAYADFGLSAGHKLNTADMERLVNVMASMPKPLLIHCWGGADRSGLAAALYLYAVKGHSAGEAARQLSVRYGHFPYLFWSDTRAMDDSFRDFVRQHPAQSMNRDTRTAPAPSH